MLSLSKARKRRIYYYAAAALLLVFSHVELVIGIFWNMNHASFSRGFAYPLLTSIQKWQVWGLPVGDFLIYAAPNVASLNSYYLGLLSRICG